MDQPILVGTVKIMFKSDDYFNYWWKNMSMKVEKNPIIHMKVIIM